MKQCEFPVQVRLCQRCVISPKMFNIYMDGVVREVNVRMLGKGFSLVNTDNGEWKINQLLFVDVCGGM